VSLAITIRADLAEFTGETWRHRVPVADLRAWLALARGQARGGKRGGPGPWARFYEADIAAIERALADLDQQKGARDGD